MKILARKQFIQQLQPAILASAPLCVEIVRENYDRISAFSGVGPLK